MEENSLRPTGAAHVASALEKFLRLRTLWLADNAFGPEGVEVLSRPLGQL
eukprot:CAMPEP_0198434558 /NCGR_PEP_ID=MMETSP1452-20131203/33334_1 /TAXON_ID=1181717 /ORGANISM="Synchroma pusillum, Strain CCMP3072" /LENGTH=49 /DNA_ID= /DNA_START= /DNA_END= /DNA_ORIENTATION=